MLVRTVVQATELYLKVGQWFSQECILISTALKQSPTLDILYVLLIQPISTLMETLDFFLKCMFIGNIT